MGTIANGDLNNTAAERVRTEIARDPKYDNLSFAISSSQDDPQIRKTYRPFLLEDAYSSHDWVSQLELNTVLKMVDIQVLKSGGERLKILVLHGSMRKRTTFSTRMRKCKELRELSKWSDGHVWISPEQHGNLTAVFKNQIDWVPLSTGSARPTQGRTLAIAQVSGGSQSFNTVNSLRVLGRWMRMFTIPNQSSIPKAYTQFTEEEVGSRLMPSGNRDRLVDCMEGFVKYTIIMRPHFNLFGDRFSEREEKRAKNEIVRLSKLENGTPTNNM